MKRIVLLVAFITATLIQAQNTTPTTTIKSTIPFQHTDETSWILRYQNDINKYQKENSSTNYLDHV